MEEGNMHDDLEIDTHTHNGYQFVIVINVLEILG
jgi:hypothetical protein